MRDLGSRCIRCPRMRWAWRDFTRSTGRGGRFCRSGSATRPSFQPGRWSPRWWCLRWWRTATWGPCARRPGARLYSEFNPSFGVDRSGHAALAGVEVELPLGFNLGARGIRLAESIDSQGSPFGSLVAEYRLFGGTLRVGHTTGQPIPLMRDADRYAQEPGLWSSLLRPDAPPEGGWSTDVGLEVTQAHHRFLVELPLAQPDPPGRRASRWTRGCSMAPSARRSWRRGGTLPFCRRCARRRHGQAGGVHGAVRCALQARF